MASLFDMALGGSSTVIAGIDNAIFENEMLFLGESKIAYIYNECLIIQSLATNNILFHHGIPDDHNYKGKYSIYATPDVARVVICGYAACTVWDVRDL